MNTKKQITRLCAKCNTKKSFDSKNQYTKNKGVCYKCRNAVIKTNAETTPPPKTNTIKRICAKCKKLRHFKNKNDYIKNQAVCLRCRQGMLATPPPPTPKEIVKADGGPREYICNSCKKSKVFASEKDRVNSKGICAECREIAEVLEHIPITNDTNKYNPQKDFKDNTTENKQKENDKTKPGWTIKSTL